MAARLDRREFLVTAPGLLGLTPPVPRPKRVAAAVTVYTHNSHADVIVSKLLQGFNLDDKNPRPALELASLYVDQVGEGDLSRGFARKYGFRLAPTIADALTLGGKELAVDGVLLVGEHGHYPVNAKGQTLYPRRRFFEQVVGVFRRSGRVVPVFSDKHLSAAWADARWMYDTARSMKIPLMAGSSVPGTWRRPPLDTPLGSGLDEIAAISFHTLDAYGFHALEMVQCLAERRHGGETGVAAVRCVSGLDVWKLGASGEKGDCPPKSRGQSPFSPDAPGRQGRYDRGLLDAALARRKQKGRPGRIEDLVPEPILFLIEYRDGLRASIFTLNGAVGEWAAAWRVHGQATPQATLFWTQEERPLGHFSFLVRGIERMMHTDKPTWPVERTLLTTGLLDALLTSRARHGVRIPTPHLAIRYKPTHAWQPPPPPPPGRPLSGP